MSAIGWLCIAVGGVAVLLLVYVVAALALIDAQVTRDHWRQQ